MLICMYEYNFFQRIWKQTSTTKLLNIGRLFYREKLQNRYKTRK